ncbi:MAG: leucine-rich repeat domain-containing protein [Ruminococcus sp.]|nr:leucine-rich repeat domain-containing protein [Ruminococcus sp.]
MKLLRSVVIPESVCRIGGGAFRDCPSPENVSFPKSLRGIESCAFPGSPKLPPETLLMGLTRRPSLDPPINFLHDPEWECALREDVFTLAPEHGCFFSPGGESLFGEIFRRGGQKSLDVIEQNGFLSAEQADRLIGYFTERSPEATAWLLEYKRRKFGFDEGDKYEL